LSSEQRTESTRRSFLLVYTGYGVRYLYLFILVPFYGRVLGPVEYGRLLAAMSIFTVVWTFCDWGFSIGGTRDAAAAGGPEVQAAVYGTQLSARLLLVAPGLAIGLLATALSPVLRETPMFGILATLNGVVSSFNLGWYFRGTSEFTKSVALEIAGFAMNLLSIMVFVRGPHDGWMVLASLLFSGIATTVCAHWIALTRFPPAAVRVRGGWRLLRECTPLFMHRGSTIMMASSTTYLLSIFATGSEVGWYGAAERISTVGQIMMQPASQVLVGKISRRLSDNNEHDDGFRIVRLGVLAMTGMGTLMAGGALLLATPVLPLILGQGFQPSIYLFKVLTLAFPFAAMLQASIELVLIPLRNDSLVSRISMLSALGGLLLMMVALQTWGTAGVAWARVLTVASTAGAVTLLLQRRGLLTAIAGGRRPDALTHPRHSA